MLAVQCNDVKNSHCVLFDVRSSSPSWQPMASPESARCFPAVAAIGEHSLVMLGGYDEEEDDTDTAQLYDARADRWTERAEWRLPAPSYGHCASVIE